MPPFPMKDSQLKALASLVDPGRFSTGRSNLELHSRDQSRHPPSVPGAVIWPLDCGEVSAILRFACGEGIPVTPWGAGSSLEGNPIPVYGGVVLDFSLMNRIIDIRAPDFQADVEPGVGYRDLNRRLRHEGLFFPPDPGAGATIGGMIANNASGTRTVRYGATRDHVLRLTVVLADGEVIETGTRASKTSSGYDLVHLFVGSEGTLGIVVAATLRLTGYPEEVSAAIATFSTTHAAGRAVFEIIRSGLDPAALELLAPECIGLINREKAMELAVAPTLFMEFHGAGTSHLREITRMAEEICRDEGCGNFSAGMGRKNRDALLAARHELGEMITRSHPDRLHMAVDVAVPVSAYPGIIALARETSRDSGIPGYTFGHAGDGNLHLVLMGKKGDAAEWDKIDAIHQRMVEEALKVGGTATGEHGIGIGKRRFMEMEHGAGLAWMKRIKELLDPKGILNPGKIFP